MGEKEQRSQNFKFTLTGAGLAAIVASIIPVIVLLRGEPTAERVADRSDQENQRLFSNQAKIQGRLIAVESKLEVLEKVCVAKAVASKVKSVPVTLKPLQRRQAAPRVGLGSLSTLGRGGGGSAATAPIRCRAGWIRAEGKCVKLRTALDLKAKKLEAAKKERQQALDRVKKIIVEKQHAERRAKRQQQMQQQLAPPAPLLRK